MGHLPPWVSARGDNEALLDVLVSPRAAHHRIMGVHDDRLKIQIAAPPVDGKANEALTRFLAEMLGIARAQVEVVGGGSSRRKTVRLIGISAQRVTAKLWTGSGLT